MMASYKNFFDQSLSELKNEGRYRTFLHLEKIPGGFPRAFYLNGGVKKEITIWCSNDYLGMGTHRNVLQQMHDVLDRDGAGSGGTRNIGGTHHWHVKLENELADLHGKESALLFTSGYVANEATLSTLGRHLPCCHIFSDERNHASMIHGIRYSGAERHIFRHNDLAHLESLLKSVPRESSKLIAFESVYSMEGDISPIEKICDLADRYGALTFVDEVHAVGLYGKRGGGITERDNVGDRVSVICANFGKAIGLMGGYIAGDAKLVDFIRSFASSFIFTTSLPPVIVAGALASIQHLKASGCERAKMQEKVKILKEKLRKSQVPFNDVDSHIIPVVVGDAELCQKMSEALLLQYGIYVQPVNFPTVPKGEERLRVTVTPFHTEEMIEEFVEGLANVWGSFGLKAQLKHYA